MVKRLAMAGAAAVLSMMAGMAAAQAACPTAADLARGIRIDFEDGSFERYRTQGPGVVVVDGSDVDGYSYRMELGQGVHLVTYADVVDGVRDDQTLISYDYGIAVTDLPLPQPGGRWATGVRVTDPGGQRSEPQSHTWGPMTRVDIGGCPYDAIEVQIAYKTDNGYLESIEYLPALGISYLVWNESDMMDRFPIRPVAISAVKK